MDFVYLIILGLFTILVTRYLLMEGIQIIAQAWKISHKTKGQILGYATSVPELVGTVATASKGLLGAGLWNIYASNIINVTLFLVAIFYYGRHRFLKQKKFADEIGFSLCAILIPMVLMSMGMQASPYTAVGLLCFFIFYIILDKRLNASIDDSPAEEEPAGQVRASKGIVLILSGVIAVVVLGDFLGIVAEDIVRKIGVAEWAVGWILGFITSLPEMTSFFAIFAAAKDSSEDDDCQEALDNLAASNMSNLGIIFPIGIAIFLLVTRG